MDAPGPTLFQRVAAILRARQYFAFMAILIYALDLVVPLVAAWMYGRDSLVDVINNARGALVDAVAAPSLAIAGLFVVYVVVMTWLRSGYLRSLVGDVHFAPRDARQYLRLLGLEVILECISAVTTGVVVLTGSQAAVVIAVVFVRLVVYFALLYSDYIIIIADVGPLRAMAMSWRTVRAAFLPSAAILLVATLLGDATAGLFTESVTVSLASAMPMMVVQCAVMGTVSFFADVILIAIYLDVVERGTLESQNRGF